MKIQILIILFLLVSTNSGNCQTITEPKELFEEGLFFFQREDYVESVFFFKQLAKKIPDNSNYHFKIGECYLNIFGREHLAVKHFEIAVKNTVAKKEYRGRDFKETNAPLHAYFYLGNAYRVNGQLNDALKAYSKFTDSPYFLGNYNLGIVENEIKSCERAKIIQDAPVKISKVKVENGISTDYSEFNAVKSKDGNTMVFVRGLKFYDAVFYSVKENGKWSKPININQNLISDGDFYPTALNNDGTKMLLVREENLNSDIYISHLKDGSWTSATELNGKINSAASETFASFGVSDDIIYLVSNRQGAKSGSDIFYSMLNKKGVWGKPKNISGAINSQHDEETPVICEDGKAIFFSSKGHYNMGGFDIFYSYLEGNKWSTPRNIGYPVNSTGDDLFYIVTNTCKEAIYSIVESETGSSDVFDIIIEEPLAIP